MTDIAIRNGTKKVAVVQMNSGADVAANLKQASKFINIAAEQGAGLIILPETFAFIGQDNRRQSVIAEAKGSGPIQDFLSQHAVEHHVWIVGGTIPLLSPDKDRVYAACVLYDANGRPAAQYNKIHLFDVFIQSRNEHYRESEAFYPGEQVSVTDTPFGKLGFAVCYDIRFPEMFRLLADKGAEIVAVPAAFTTTTGAAHWHTLLKTRAVENLMYVAAAAQVGNHPNERTTYGHSMIINPWGDICEDLNGKKEGVGLAAINTAEQQQLRTDFPCLSHRVFKITA